MGILLLAMLISGPLAIAAFAAGYSFWMALAIYSGAGIAAAMALAIMVFAGSALKMHRPPRKRISRADASA